MDAGYVVLICLIGFIALMILWTVAGISPIGILRLAFGSGVSVNRSQPIMVPSTEMEKADRTSSPGGSRWVAPVEIAETHQFKPTKPVVYDPAHDPSVISHKMSRKELTILLAVQKDEDGAYRFSANKIAEFVGGTSAEIKGWVAEVRGRREPASNSLRRPTGGWGRAS